MQVQTDAERRIIAYGFFPTADPAITVTAVDDAEAVKLSELGIKILNPDGTITVMPPEVDRVAHAALMEQKASDAEDHALIRTRAKTDPVFAALARQLGITI